MGSFHRRTMQVVGQSAASETRALVLAEARSPDCGRCGGCSSGLTGGVSQVGINLPKNLTDQQNQPRLEIGQSIEMAVPSAMLLALSSLVYLLPVVLMLCFAVSCDLLLAATEGQVAVSAAVGLCLGLVSIVFSGPAVRSYISRHVTLRGGKDSHQ